MNTIKLSPSFFLVIILIALAISPAFALGEGNRNLLLIGVMGVSPILILKYRKFYWSEVWLLLFMVSIVLAPLFNQPASMRWSTVLYSFMFGVTFIAYVRLLHRNKFSIESYQKLLMFFMYAYFVVLLIQQFCVLIGLPVFNVSNYDLGNPWKLNSLAAEPSHSARIVALLMYCYIITKEIIKKRKYDFRSEIKKDKWVWLAFLWTMVTMGSGTAFVFIFIVLLKFMKIKSLIPLVVVVSVIIILVSLMGITVFDRTFKIFIATLSFDANTIIQADHSASIRIVPMMILAEMVDLTTLNGWFGHGIDYVSSILSLHIPGIPENTSGGGLLQLCTEYGFLSFLLFIIFSVSINFNKKDYLSLVFLFMLVLMNSLNSQITWLCIVLLFSNNYFLNKRKSS